MLVRLHLVPGLERRGHVFPGERLQAEELLDVLGHLRQHRLQIDGEDAEQLEIQGTEPLQRRVLAGLLGDLPGLLLVHVLVHAVGEEHDLADRLAELARLVVGGDGVGEAPHLEEDRRGLLIVGHRGGEVAAHLVLELAARGQRLRRELAREALPDEARRAARDVHVLAHEVGIHPREEVVGVEVQVLDARVQLGGEVVAHPLGIQPQLDVALRAHRDAARLGHLLAGELQEAVHVDVVGHLALRELERRWPEERVEIDDVLADEVDLLHLRIGEILVEVLPLLAEVVLQRREVADGRVQPHVEVLARGAGDLDPEVGRVARDVPVVEAAVEPLLHLVGDLGLELAVLGPAAQELHAARVGELEEEVLGLPQHGLGAGEGRVRVLEVGRGVDRAAVLAGVAVLVLGAAFRALALDVAVGEEHLLHRVEELLDGLRVDEAGLLQGEEDLLGELGVLRRVGGVEVVPADAEALVVAPVRFRHAGDQLLRRDALGLGLQHDGSAVGVVGADEIHLVALQALEADPDVRLHILHDVADVERAVGVWERRSDEKLAGH